MNNKLLAVTMRAMTAFAIVFATQKSFSQVYLARQLSIEAITERQLAEILESISAKGGFHFAYNADRVPADSLVNTTAFDGTLEGYLENLLGDQYEFKEMSGYIVIRHTPKRLQPSIAVESATSNSLIVQGQIRDAETNHGIPRVSVYDKNSFAATLSDKQGNFELKIKKPDQSVWVDISKENYRDTTLVILVPVDLRLKRKSVLFKYYPGSEQRNPINETWLGRAFVSSKQRIEQLNIGNIFADRSYQLSLLPGIGTQSSFNSRAVNKVSMNIIGGRSGGVSAMELSGIYSIIQQDVQYFQVAGMFNLVGGNVKGLQVAGAFNTVVGNVAGVQVAAISNVSGDVNGLQASAYNEAKSVKGTQIGVVNVADSSDYPIGLVNLVKSGRKSLSVETEESYRTSLNLRTGGRVLYGLLGLGYSLNNQVLPYSINAGLGAHVINRRFFDLDAELVAKHHINGTFNRVQGQYGLNLLPQVKLGSRLGIFAGPTLNISTGYDNRIVDRPRWAFSESAGGEHHTVLHGGIIAGLRFSW